MEEQPLASEALWIAPGTPLRDGLDRIVSSRTGALVVLGRPPELEPLMTGGFALDVPFTPSSLRELAKMDGAIVLSDDRTRIVAAAVHLSPSSGVPTSESGTRHRTAERIARQTGVPTITVSAAMGTISLFTLAGRQPVPRPEQLMSRAGQVIESLAAHRGRLLRSLDHLSALEFADAVTMRDLAQVAQRFEMVDRLADEAAGYAKMLGVDGRLTALRLRDLTEDVRPLGSLLQRDYAPTDADAPLLAALGRLDDSELFDIVLVERALRLGDDLHLDSRLRPRGFRQLSAVPFVSATTVAAVVDHLGTLTAIHGASVEELADIPGVGARAARLLHDGLARRAARVTGA